jgi:hypothetical protein
MKSFRITGRGALGRARRLRALLGRAGRLPATLGAAPALALVATLLVSALGPPTPLIAAAEPAEPAARLQVVVKEVTIHDDRDLFSPGDMRIYARVVGCREGIPPPCQFEGEHQPILAANTLVYASTGDTVKLERLVPGYGDDMLGDDVSYALGFPIYAGHSYVVTLAMDERDPKDDYMGSLHHVLDTGEHGLGLGTHTRRSFKEEQYQWGDFTVTYEIRHAPVPDLRPVNIKVHDLLGSSKKLVCMAVQNIELGDAGPFEVALRVDGVVPPDGRATAGRLGSGEAGELCVEAALPTSGPHLLAAVVDEPRSLAEFNETNNVYEQTYSATPLTSAPTSSSAQADLTVGAIRVNGHVPDGKDDCKDGENAVAVVVKNAGAAAGAFALRLVVDGDDEAKEKPVADLEGGQEREVRFDDVRLKQGERTLTAVADAKDALAESKEDNNELKVTARCKDD